MARFTSTLDKTYGNVPIIVLKGSGPNLLGRDCLSFMSLDWKKVIRINTMSEPKLRVGDDEGVTSNVKAKLETMFKKYKPLFDDRIGRIKGYKAKIQLKKDFQPKRKN